MSDIKLTMKSQGVEGVLRDMLEPHDPNVPLVMEHFKDRTDCDIVAWLIQMLTNGNKDVKDKLISVTGTVTDGAQDVTPEIVHPLLDQVLFSAEATDKDSGKVFIESVLGNGLGGVTLRGIYKFYEGTQVFGPGAKG